MFAADVAAPRPQAVAVSTLPEGAGLAQRAASRAELRAHPEVIFADDFEEGRLGEGWDEVGNREGRVLSWSDPGAMSGLGRRCLRVEAHLGQDTGGGLTKWFTPADRLFIRFYTRFDRQCDYVHHFVTLRANKGLTGKDRWSGFGGAGLKPMGDERFSTAIEPWGNWARFTPPGRWNFYSYWHEMEASPDRKYWGNSFLPEGSLDIPKERWVCVEFMIQHNTPGQRDGEQAFWIDGRRAGHWKGFNWRTDERLKANALTVESYITDRWTKQATNVVEFDEVVIAKAYVGPVRPHP